MKKYLGTITKTKGYNGKLIVADLAYSISIPADTEVYIGYSDTFAKNYIISEWELKSKKAFVKIKGIDDDKAASEFPEHGIFIDDEHLIDFLLSQDKLDLDNNFVLVDENNNIIGEIKEQWELPANDVWIVNTDRGELLVPVLDQNIIEIDEAAKKVIYKMTDGLMDLLDNSKKDDE